ncbi:MAG: FG-GAP-like repeat-containing protein [Enterobacterales bacterium]|nr:FG-GAP-like repeat-containing protein [Enterobacterales bacterium]
MCKHQVIFSFIFLLAVNSSAGLAQEISEEIESLFDEVPIVDGLLSPAYRDSTKNYLDIYSDTSINIISNRLANASSGFDQHIQRYERLKSTRHFVLTSADLTSAQINDSEIENLIYQQKLWKIDFNGGNGSAERAADYSLLINSAQQWIDNGLRIMQLEYSPGENRNLYDSGEQYAGVHSENIDPGLTRYGRWLARYALENGVILDVSHSRHQTVVDVVNLSLDYSKRRNRAVPVLANHANLNQYFSSERNKTIEDTCLIASTGGSIGIMPIASFLPGNASFLDLSVQLMELKNHNCAPLTSWDGKPIQMIDHISIASDSRVDYWEPTGNSFYVDANAEQTNRWKILATYMRKDNNGDGIADFSIVELKKIFGGNLIRIYRAGLLGQLPFEPGYSYSSIRSRVYTGDFNGDGSSDLLLQNANGDTWIDYSYRGGEYRKINWQRSNTPPSNDRSWCRLSNKSKLFVGDFNGDGKDDLLCHQSNGKNWIDFANTQGTFQGTDWQRVQTTAGSAAAWCQINHNRKLYIGDFNGDGRDDLLCHQSDGKSWIDFANTRGLFNGTDWSRTSQRGAIDRAWCQINQNRKLYIGDFNGDGFDDLLCQNAKGGSWIDYSNGRQIFSGTDWSRVINIRGLDRSWCRISGNIKLYVGDFNGDSKDDLLCFNKKTRRVLD